MSQYVAGFMKDGCGRVALVRKKKPRWQCGLLNGIGGKIEVGETADEAMAREWREETGAVHEDWTRFAELKFHDSVVHFYKAHVQTMPAINFLNDIEEVNEVHNYELVSRRNDIIPNLKWLLPLAFDDPQASFAVLFGNGAIGANDNNPMAVAA